MKADRYLFREDVGRDTFSVYRRRAGRTKRVARFRQYEDVQTYFRLLCLTPQPEHDGGVWYKAARERLPQPSNRLVDTTHEEKVMFEKGTPVLVTPKANDLFTHEFVGTVVGTKTDGTVTVVDGDGDHFDVDADQLVRE